MVLLQTDGGDKNEFNVRSILDGKIQRVKIEEFIDESDLIF